MAKRIDKIFDEIKSLSKDEKREFLSHLPKALSVSSVNGLKQRSSRQRNGSPHRVCVECEARFPDPLLSHKSKGLFLSLAPSLLCNFPTSTTRITRQHP